MQETALLEQKDLREECIERIEVLDKIKNLLLLPNTDYATLEQVAMYYEVGSEAIKSIIKRNIDELESDGFQTFKKDNVIQLLKVQDETLETVKGKTILKVQDETLEIPNRGLRLFPRRAILRVGMLLRDSQIAREIRTQLLNIEEKTTESQKTEEINEEKKLFMNIMFASNDAERAIAVNELYKYNERNKAKIDYHDSVLHADKLITTKDVAKDLGMTDRKLYKILKENKVLYKEGKIYKPYAKYDFLLSENYADYHINEYGQTFKWFEKGRKWIIEHIENWNN